NRKDYEMYLGIPGTGSSPTGDLQIRFKTGGTFNAVQLADPDLDALIAKQQAEANEQARRQVWTDIQRKILAVNGWIPIFSATVLALQWKWLHNFYQRYYDYYTLEELTESWLDPH